MSSFPLPRADTTSFNRFLTSLGLLLLVVALIGPFLYFHDTSLLRFPRKEMAQLTDQGRNAMKRRQEATITMEKPVLIGAGLLVLAGCVCVGVGGWRLWKLQVKEDAALDRQALLESGRINQQSEREKQKRREEQAREAVAGPDGGKLDLAESRMAVGRTENRLGEVLTQDEFPPFDFYSEVTVAGEDGSGQIAIDGLFHASGKGSPDVVLEQKLLVGDPEARLVSFTNAILAQLARYRTLTGRDAIGWLVLVRPKDAGPISDAERKETERKYDQALGRLGHATILGEDEIASAPVRFRILFSPDDDSST